MANKRPRPTAKSLLNLKKIKKGQVLNPLGAGAHNPELRAIRRLTAIELAEVASLILDKDLKGLEQLIKDAQLPECGISGLKVWIATIAAKGIKAGDSTRLDAILNRVVGKPKDHISMKILNKGSLSAMSDAELEQKAAAIAARIRSQSDEPSDGGDQGTENGGS